MSLKVQIRNFRQQVEIKEGKKCGCDRCGGGLEKMFDEIVKTFHSLKISLKKYMKYTFMINVAKYEFENKFYKLKLTIERINALSRLYVKVYSNLMIKHLNELILKEGFLPIKIVKLEHFRGTWVKLYHDYKFDDNSYSYIQNLKKTYFNFYGCGPEKEVLYETKDVNIKTIPYIFTPSLKNIILNKYLMKSVYVCDLEDEIKTLKYEKLRALVGCKNYAYYSVINLKMWFEEILKYIQGFDEEIIIDKNIAKHLIDYDIVVVGVCKKLTFDDLIKLDCKCICKCGKVDFIYPKNVYIDLRMCECGRIIN